MCLHTYIHVPRITHNDITKCSNSFSVHTHADRVCRQEQKIASEPVKEDAPKKLATTSQWDDEGSGGFGDLFFYIRSESVHHDQVLAEDLKDQLVEAGLRKNNVILQHRCVEEWEETKDGPPFHVDYWTLTPLLVQLDAKLQARSGAPPSWIVIVEPK